MPVPRGFLEISADAAAMGPFSDVYPQGAASLSYPVFGRFLVYWGDPKAPVPSRVTDYPAAVLYGGPAPFGWTSQTLATRVREWAATLAPHAGAGPGAWLVVALPSAFLVPPEALPFPHRDFRWAWFIDQGPPAQYALEGVKLAPLFRNLSTKQLDLPPPLGAGPVAIAGMAPGEDAMAEEDVIDPIVQVWLTPEEAALEPTLDVWPAWVELGATPKVWAIHDVWESIESGIWRLVSRSQPTYETEQQAKSWKSSWLVKNFGKSGFKSPYVWVHKSGGWELAA